MTHMSGGGCATNGDVFFTATTGTIMTKVSDYQTPYSHKSEAASPGFYQVQLLQWAIDAKLSATERTGVAQFTFPAYVGQEGIESINTIHYVPAKKVDYDSVASTLEYSLAYASLNRLAIALGKDDEAKRMYDRALYYRSVFDPDQKFFRQRNSDGSWVPDFNPAQDGHGFVEGTSWHYFSFAPAVFAWMVQTMGKDKFNERMTEFFDYPSPGWYGQYYDPENETDLQAPFAFNFSGQPWKSQQVVRRVLSENYLDDPGGIPGNDDCGAMSSWAVLSMMGIYSVDPPSLAYELVSPIFPSITIHLQPPYSGKSFTIKTTPNPAMTPYVQRVSLNGRSHSQNWISFHNISEGGTLQFTLGARPDTQWGAAPHDAPPSLSDTPATQRGK